MPSYVSPGVYTLEKDLSQFAPTINSSIVGLVGFASKGPVNKATLITSPQQLVDVFGKPSEDIQGQGLEGGVQILETTNALYFVRCSTSTSAVEASAVVQFGACPAIGVSGSDGGSGYLFGEKSGDDGGLGVSANAYFRVSGTDNAGASIYPTGYKDFACVTSLAADISDNDKQTKGEELVFKSLFGGDLEYGKVGAYFRGSYLRNPYLVNPIAGSGASLTITAWSDSAGGDVGLSCLTFIDGLTGDVSSTTNGTYQQWASSLTVKGTSFWAPESGAPDTSATGYLVESLYPGAGYNLGTQADGATSGNSVEIDAKGNQNWVLTVNQDGAAAENFQQSFVNSGSFVTDVLNTADVGSNNKSGIVVGNFVSGSTSTKISSSAKLDNFTQTFGTLIAGVSNHGTWGGASNSSGTMASAISTNVNAAPGAVASTYNGENSRFIKLLEGTDGLAGGTNGVGTTTENATALIGDSTATPKTGMQALDNDVINISIAAVPGVSTESVQNNLITLAETSQNFIALVSTPYGVGSVQDAINWSNGQSAYRTSPINSSYVASYWPWVKVFSQFDSKDVWYDPAIFAIRQMTFTDSISDPWFAPAGYQRGRLTTPTDLEVSLTQGDRDTMYSGGNVLNPIQKWPQDGIMIWGQRTMKRTPSALDRVNVRRLMIFLRKLILASTREFVFEPNDTFTWDSIKGVLNPALQDIRNRRGIVDYKVVCDESTNTPIRIDRNELWTKVIVKPTKTAEMLVFEINLTSQGATLA